MKKADNEAVLKGRLAVLNNTLDQAIKPDPRIWKKKHHEYDNLSRGAP